jgi:hypothetical protein
MAYRAPGMIEELSSTTQQAWNERLSAIFQSQIALATRLVEPDAPRAWLFDPIADGTGGTAEATISWTAFPKRVSGSGLPPSQGWQLVDADRNGHEEYCEWEVARDASGKVVRVTFTCETEDYFEFLSDRDEGLLLELYHRHVSPNVELADLRSANGAYNPQNRWNFPQNGGARGLIMHMGQVNNSFGAAVNLSAVATWPRVSDQGVPIVGEQELIACARFGDRVRHSDPHIGSEINKLVRAGNEISFADPVGLYMDSVDLSDFELPAGVAPGDLMRVIRGSVDHMLRVIFEAPAGSGFVLGDVRIGGSRIRFGSQIAEKVNVRIRGIARPAANRAPALGCDNHPGATLLDAAEADFATLSAISKSRLSATLSSLSAE